MQWAEAREIDVYFYMTTPYISSALMGRGRLCPLSV